jgi:hypothetical protein
MGCMGIRNRKLKEKKFWDRKRGKMNKKSEFPKKIPRFFRN